MRRRGRDLSPGEKVRRRRRRRRRRERDEKNIHIIIIYNMCVHILYT